MWKDSELSQVLLIKSKIHFPVSATVHLDNHISHLHPYILQEKNTSAETEINRSTQSAGEKSGDTGKTVNCTKSHSLVNISEVLVQLVHTSSPSLAHCVQVQFTD